MRFFTAVLAMTRGEISRLTAPAASLVKLIAYCTVSKSMSFRIRKTSDDTDAVFIGSDIEKRVREIKGQPGQNIWLYGGGKLITTFLNLDLIDEYRLAVHPVIIGKGKPLFHDIADRHKLVLVETKAHASGVTQLHYKRRFP